VLIEDKCEGVGLVLDALVGGLEISKSKKIQVQILDKTPLINIDHVDQATVYLSKTGLDVEIITTSTVGVNVCPPLMLLMADSSSEREGGRRLL
jgi:Adenylate cyclase associated (CAP) C terminal